MKTPKTDSRGSARFGVFVPFTNTNLEPDMMLMRPPGVSVHFARLGGYDADEIPDEEQMAELGAADMEEPLRLIQGVKPDVVFYGCTSATLTHGPAFDRDLARRISAGSGARTVTAAGALVHAIRSLGVQRIAFASPYVPTINDQAIAFLRREGIDTVSRADIEGTLDNEGQGALSPDDVAELAHRADAKEAEAIVLSCTDMRSVEVIARLEDALGKPVITSNQAMVFQAVEMLELPAPGPRFGRLFEGCTE
ncbi:MAG: Asp/Glu racemase [Pseudomonadota bacterium]